MTVHPAIDLRPWAQEFAALWALPGLAETVRIEFSSRLSASLGRSVPERGVVRLHEELRSAPRARVREVLCHELAHVAAFQIEGRAGRAHGPTWAALMEKAGYAPRTCLPAGGCDPRRSVGRRRYRHSCPICHSAREARRPMRRWRCSRCLEAGLSGDLLIRQLT